MLGEITIIKTDSWFFNDRNGRGARIVDTGIYFRVLFNGGEPDFETDDFEDALYKVREYIYLAPESDPKGFTGC